MLALNDQIQFTLKWFKNRHQKTYDKIESNPQPFSSREEVGSYNAYFIYKRLEIKYSK